MLQVSVTEELVPKVEDSLIVGFEIVPFRQKFYYGNEYVFVW